MEQTYNYKIWYNLAMITEKIRGVEVKFETKSGVFSKRGLDAGSRFLLESVQIKDGSLVADLGTGTGVIGFVVAKLSPQGHVHLLEDHIRAAELAKKNALINRLKNVEVFLSDLFSAVADRSYDLILSNPPQHLGNELLEEAASECLKHLKKGGQVIWVMQKHLKPYVERLFKKVFKDFEVVARSNEYIVIKAKR